MKQHRLHRIAQTALARAQPTAWALLVLGVTAFLLLPLAGNKCYLDEKALLVGGALPTARHSGAFSACMAAYQQALPAAGSDDIAVLVNAAAAGVAATMPSAGPPLAFHRHLFNSSGGGQCGTLHTVVRSPRGDGSEGFVLLLPLHAGAGASSAAAALAAALGLAAAAHLRLSGWLAKDVALVFTDAGCSGVTEGAQEWLSAYSSGADLFAFPRAGLLQQALIVELAGAPDGASSAHLSVHGTDGQLPNMDLFYLIKRNLDLHTPLPVSLRASSAPLPAWPQRVADVAGDAAAAVGLLQPAAARTYAAELATLAAFTAQLGSGQPTGAHAPFLAQQVDAATLALRLPALSQVSSSSGSSSRSSGSSLAPPPHLQAAAATVLAALEMCLRTFNNLQERLHHSTALYALLSADRFVSIGAYLAPPGCLLLAALAQLVAASRSAAGTPLAGWRSAWRRVAAAHALVLAGTAAAAQLHAGISQQWLPPGASSGGIAWLAQQWMWAAGAAAVASAGPTALLAAIRPGRSSGGSSSDHPGTATRTQVQRCTTVVALAAVVLQGAHLLMAQWVRCFAFLLAAVPLHALAAQRPSAGAGRLAARAALLAASCAAVWLLDSSGAAWLAALLLPHFVLVSLT